LGERESTIFHRLFNLGFDSLSRFLGWGRDEFSIGFNGEVPPKEIEPLCGFYCCGLAFFDLQSPAFEEF
jgi:hypothetical protein